MGQQSSRPTGFGGYYGSKEPMMTRATLFYAEKMLLQSHGGGWRWGPYLVHCLGIHTPSQTEPRNQPDDQEQTYHR